MSGGDCGGSPNGGLEALLKAARFVEEQEKQKLRNFRKQTSILRPKLLEKKLEDLHAAAQNVEREVRNSLAQSYTSVQVPTCLTVSTVQNGFSPLPVPPIVCRTPTPPLSKHGSIIREVHNKLEKNRRAHLKECFETLKKQLPHPPEDKKSSNLSILHNAIRFIAVLRRKEREFEHDMERLAREKIAHQQRLSCLKKELTAQWEHIDLNTLVPEIVEPEPRRISDLMNGRAVESATGSEDEFVRTSTQYSSTSSLSSTSPLHSVESVTNHTQVINSPGPPSLLVSPIQQLLPSTTVRMLPADAHFMHSHIPTTGITIQNGMLNHGSVALAAKHPVSTENSSSALLTSGLLNHSLVVPQPSGSFLLATPSHLSDKMMTAPVPLPLQPQFLVKPTMVVVSAAANTSN